MPTSTDRDDRILCAADILRELLEEDNEANSLKLVVKRLYDSDRFTYSWRIEGGLTPEDAILE